MSCRDETQGMKGILLAGGAGTRLWPLTASTSKQMLPVYDKPAIYYPLSLLMLAKIREILIISTSEHLPSFRRLFGTGEQFGIELAYAEQPRPGGIAEAFMIGDEHIDGHPSCLALGDNILYGQGLGTLLSDQARRYRGACILGYRVGTPGRYGVVELNEMGRAIGIEEKPVRPRSKWAVPGLYFYDGTAVERARTLARSGRGELEITDLNRTYLEDGALDVVLLGRGIAWFDVGTCQQLLAAGNYVEAIQSRQGTLIACPEEIALNNGWINESDVWDAIGRVRDNIYANGVARMLRARGTL